MASDDDRPVVLLATCAHLPDGEEWAGTDYLLPALAGRALEGRWVVWDDPSVDWSQATGVPVCCWPVGIFTTPV